MCIRDRWPTDPAATFCALYPNAILGTCSTYDAVLTHGVDTGSIYYYDAQSGALVATVWYGASVRIRRCNGGPASFVEPTCDFQSNVCRPPGANGGAGGATGAAIARPSAGRAAEARGARG